MNVTLSNGTDIWSNAIVSTPESGGTFTITKMSYGDVDDDGIILAYDAALILQRLVEIDPLPLADPLPWENWRESTADVDLIDGVTFNDASSLVSTKYYI